ncbi:MarR family winged helix-turn-helix transcriptional regulator [Vagococcus entomophilus]|uniref:HTH marR-type domain-containing protein n=1 Tax=Vagococcus entomophilus TaxID=1160095 RepID=A0A430AJK4_9ENTE|nr:MarR family winged helix-turn-helix transcriptional regulator [Vagococcus entomophilus]RSU08292.1 hypothetical protein CBF30_03360 [Vagococcus entomophilus]
MSNSFPSKFAKNSEASTGFLFIKTYNLWHTRIKAELSQLDLTHPQFVALTTLAYLLEHQEEVNQRMVADLAEIDVMTLSQIVRLLVQKAYIEKTVSRLDPRANALSLTSLGYEKIQKAVPVVEKLDAQFFGLLGSKQETFRESLKLLVTQKKEQTK